MPKTTRRAPLQPRILRLCAELNIRLISATSQSEYVQGREIQFAVKDDGPRAEDYIVERVFSGEAFAVITHWGTGRVKWGAQRITGRSDERYLEGATIYRSAATLPEILKEVAS